MKVALIRLGFTLLIFFLKRYQAYVTEDVWKEICTAAKGPFQSAGSMSSGVGE